MLSFNRKSKRVYAIDEGTDIGSRVSTNTFGTIFQLSPTVEEIFEFVNAFRFTIPWYLYGIFVIAVEVMAFVTTLHRTCFINNHSKSVLLISLHPIWYSCAECSILHTILSTFWIYFHAI